jgi:hypothetical protein
MASENNRIVVGDTVINLEHILYVVRDARGVTIYFDTPIPGSRGLVGQAFGTHRPYELRLQGRAGQQFWHYYMSGATSVESGGIPRIGAYTR